MIRVILIISILLSATQLLSQRCDLDICNSDDCGDVKVSFSSDGQNVFCEGVEEVRLVNTSTTMDFDEFIISWGDGSRDTVYNYDDITHIYDFADTSRCDLAERFSFEYCYVGIKYCGQSSFSCNWGSSVLTVQVKPEAVIESQPEICIDNAIQFFNGSCNQTNQEWDFGDGTISNEPNPIHQYSAPGVYQVQLTAINDCGLDVDIKTIEVVTQPLAVFDFNTDQNGLCIPATINLNNLSKTISETNPSGRFLRSNWIINPPINPDSPWCFIDTVQNLSSRNIDIILKEIGEFYITLEVINDCGQDIATDTLRTLDAPILELDSVQAACNELVYSPTIRYTNEESILSYQWSFENGSPATSLDPFPQDIMFNTPGKNRVTLLAISDCGNRETFIDIEILSTPELQIIAPTSVCSTSAPDTIRANINGGTWSGPGIDEITGVFDPGSLPIGQTQITYSLANLECVEPISIFIEIVQAPELKIEGTNQCINEGSQQLYSNIPGGIWEGDGIVDASGIFNPELIGPGVYNLNYEVMTDAGCSLFNSIEINVEDLPDFVIPDTTFICDFSDQLDLYNELIKDSEINRNQLIWNGDAVSTDGIVGLDSIGALYPISVIYTGSLCSVTDTFLIQFIERPLLQTINDTTICIGGDPLILTPNILGGIWSGQGIESISGSVDIADLSPGMYEYTYTVNGGSNCEQTINTIVEILDLSATLDAGSDLEFCDDNLPSTFLINDVMPLDGRWESTELLTESGLINIPLMDRDSTYSFEYCISSDLTECSACQTKNVIIHSLPTASFDIPSRTCINENITLINNSQNATSYTWDFGDGSVSSTFEPVHQYDSPGDYTITLNAVSQDGCRSTSITQDISVSQAPIPAFTINDSGGCQPFNIKVNNLSIGDDISSTWYWSGNPVSDANINLEVIDGINQDTLIPLILEVENLCATVADTQFLSIIASPLAILGAAIDEGCAPFEPEIANVSIGNPTSYQWDYGEGTLSRDSTPLSIVYPVINDSISNYTVELIVENQCGRDTSTEVITVYPPDVTAFIGLDTLAGCAPLTVPIRNLSTSGSIINWQWYANDSLIGTSKIDEPNIQLSNAGRYNIILSAARCGIDLDTAQVVVLETPEANFSIPDEVCLNDTIPIENLSPEGIAYSWTINDNIFSTIRNPEWVVTQSGNQNISLEITNDVGCSDTALETIRVNEKPIRSSTIDLNNGCQPLIITGEVMSVSGDAIVWNWGNGSSTVSASATHLYESSGVYDVTVSITDQNGCSADSTIESVTVHPLPTIDFSLNQETFCTVYDSIITTNISMGAASYVWEIGDLQLPNSSIALPLSNSNLKHIKLVGTTSFGCTDSLSKSLTIYSSPLTEFSLVEDSYCLGEAVQVMNESSFSNSYIWDDDTGNIYNSVEPSIIFSDTGRYSITLTSYNSENNCPADSQVSEVHIRPTPSNLYTYSFTDSCTAETIVEIENITNNVVSTIWLIDGIERTQAFSPSFDLGVGTYDLALMTENIYGCKDLSSELITIYNAPNSLISGLNSSYCLGDELIVSNQGLGSSFWTLSDIGTFDNQSLQVVLNHAGTFDIEVIGANGPYCSDTLTSSFTVYETPIADFDFIANSDDYIIGDVQFINKSDFYSRLEWDLGDGTVSNAEDIEHIYDINPPISTTLTAINDHNGVITCSDIITRAIESEWLTTFYAPNAMAPEGGLGDAKYFKPVGLGISEYTITIYSPWGQAVWHSEALSDNSPSEFWDGSDANGNPLPQGVYLWKAEVSYINKISKTYSGDIHLIR